MKLREFLTTDFMEKLLLQLDDAERELVWYLQHETFNAERERKLRADCCRLRTRVALVTEARMMHGLS